MATASSTHDNISCSLCLEVFTDPRSLPCGHTFCLKCLQDHISSRHDDRTFTCPLCRLVVNIPDWRKPASSWARQFGRNRSLVDAIDLINQMEISDTTKDPNQRLLKKSCESLQYLSQLIQKQVDDDIEDFRRDVDVSAAQTAAQIDARGDEIIASFTAAVHAVVKTKKKELEESRQTTNKDILKMYVNVFTLLDDLKKYLVLGDKLMQSGSLSEIKTNLPKFNKIQKETADYFSKRRSKIPHIKLSLTEPNKTRNKPFSIDIGTISAPDMKSFSQTHTIKTDVHTLHTEVQTLHTDVQTLHTDVQINRKSDLLKLEQTINTKIQSDKNDPFLRSILVLEDKTCNRIIVTDWKNTCVKLFSAQNKTVESFYKTRSRPYGLAKSRDQHVLVTLPRVREILYLSIERDQIQLNKTLTTKKEYDYIAVLHDDSLAVCEEFNCVDVLNERGDVIRSFDNNLIPGPRRLTVTADSLIVVSLDNTVRRVTSSGQVTLVSRDSARYGFLRGLSMSLVLAGYGFQHGLSMSLDLARYGFQHGLLMSRDSARYGDLCGVTSDIEEFIYVCDEERNLIVQLSSNGQRLRDVITQQDGLEEPWDICCDENKVYVLQNNNQIKIFTWKKL